MKKWRQWLSGLVLFALLLPSCGLPQAEEDTYDIPVLLSAADGMTVEGDNPVLIKPGEDAVFPVKLDIGFSVLESERYSYADGKLTVKNVRYPATVDVGLDFDVTVWGSVDPAQIPRGENFDLKASADNGNYGIVEASHHNGTHPSATEVILTAKPTSKGRFVCWSIGGSVAKGGTPLAYTEQYSFFLGMDMNLVANFASAESATVFYHANGGTTAEGNVYLRNDSPLDFYFFPHALANQGQLRREGYVLYAYNTEPDGSGTEYNFGANLPVPVGETEILYAQWAAVDPSVFEYQVIDGKVNIMKCTSTEEWVVIPETIDGLPVTNIRAGAFSNLKNMTTLVSNANVEVFAPNAVRGCPNFTTLYLCDNIKSISDRFYVDCPEFQNLRLSAVRNPTKMKNRGGTFHIKFQRLMQAKDEGKDVCVVLSGSSSEYGFHSPTFEELMDYAYFPVNHGTSVQLPSLFFLEVFSHFLDEGDIVIQAPESDARQVGGNALISNFWSCYEGVPEVFNYVDIRNYTNVFSTLSDFNAVRDKEADTSYSDHNELIDRYGDNCLYKVNPSPAYAAGSGRSFSSSLITETYAKRLNAAYDAVRATGAKVYISFAPVNLNSLSKTARTQDHQLAYQKHFEERLDAPVISNFSDYILAGKYFYNSDYHPSTEGAILRTKKLVADLKAQLAKEAAEAS